MFWPRKQQHWYRRIITSMHGNTKRIIQSVDDSYILKRFGASLQKQGCQISFSYMVSCNFHDIWDKLYKDTANMVIVKLIQYRFCAYYTSIIFHYIHSRLKIRKTKPQKLKASNKTTQGLILIVALSCWFFKDIFFSFWISTIMDREIKTSNLKN